MREILESPRDLIIIYHPYDSASILPRAFPYGFSGNARENGLFAHHLRFPGIAYWELRTLPISWGIQTLQTQKSTTQQAFVLHIPAHQQQYFLLQVTKSIPFCIS